MNKLRIFFYALVFLNLAFFAWAQGLFTAHSEIHEPQRLTQQINADSMRLVSNTPPAVAPESLATVCQAIGGLSQITADQVLRDVASLGGIAQRMPKQSYYRVFISGLATQALAESKKTALLAKKLEPIKPLSEMQVQATKLGGYRLLVGLFGDVEAAQARIALLKQNGEDAAVLEKPDVAAQLDQVVQIKAKVSVVNSQIKSIRLALTDTWVMDCAP